LTPEELERYRATGILIREEKHMGTLTKEQYLQLRLQGKGRTEIMKEYYKSSSQAFYRQLQTWGIKEKDAEERELELMAAVRKSGTDSDTQPIAQPADEPDPAAPESPSSLAKQLEQLILRHTQPQTESVTSKIKKWAQDRNLHIADPYKQVLKLGEEYGELCRGLAVRDRSQVIDAIGDMYVALTVLSLQLGLDVEKCIEAAYEEIKDRKGRMVNGVFVKESDISA
jgi:NTP pyrophosphatase (non-canonical NTP hydrolase)